MGGPPLVPPFCLPPDIGPLVRRIGLTIGRVLPETQEHSANQHFLLQPCASRGLFGRESRYERSDLLLTFPERTTFPLYESSDCSHSRPEAGVYTHPDHTRGPVIYYGDEIALPGGDRTEHQKSRRPTEHLSVRPRRVPLGSACALLFDGLTPTRCTTLSTIRITADLDLLWPSC